MYVPAYLPSETKAPATAWLLGVASVVPLWLATLLYWSTSDAVGTGFASAAAIAYGAIMLTFLGGIRWGLAIAPAGRTVAGATLVLSVLPGVAGFAAMLLPVLLALTVLVCGFLLHALWDVIAADDGRLPPWFANLRMVLTALAVPALLLLIARQVLTGIT